MIRLKLWWTDGATEEILGLNINDAFERAGYSEDDDDLDFYTVMTFSC